MKHERELTALDAVRLLCNAIQQVQHLDKNGEGLTVPCKDTGEFMLCSALEYLAFGDTTAARELLDEYDRWVETGEYSWPYREGDDPSKWPEPGEIHSPHDKG